MNPSRCTDVRETSSQSCGTNRAKDFLTMPLISDHFTLTCKRSNLSAHCLVQFCLVPTHSVSLSPSLSLFQALIFTPLLRPILNTWAQVSLLLQPPESSDNKCTFKLDFTKYGCLSFGEDMFFSPLIHALYFYL